MSFQYDAEHARTQQIAPEGATSFLPDGEVFTPTGGTPVFHTYFEVHGQRVAEDYGPAGVLQHHYFHNDYQNSIDLVTDDKLNCGTGSLCNTTPGLDQNSGFDAWGQSRNANGTVDPNWGANAATTRGYINQEQLTDLHLIDLNARVYDPAIAQFLSPDPVISDQDDSQSWNAYAYSHNNPMSVSDPTGLDGDPECDGFCQTATAIYGGVNTTLQGSSQQTYKEVNASGQVIRSDLSIQQATDAYVSGDKLGPGVRGDIAGYVAAQLHVSVSSLYAGNGTLGGQACSGCYREAANTTFGKVVQGVATVATDVAGQLPIAGAELGTDGAQTPAVPAEEIVVTAAGRKAGKVAGEAADVAVYYIEGPGGVMKYVGIANNLVRRAREHAQDLIKIAGNLTREMARNIGR